MTDVQTLDIEEVLKRAGPDGLTVNEIMEQTGSSETTTRRKVKALMADEKVVRRPTLNGTKLSWAEPEPEPEPEPEQKPEPDAASTAASDGRQLSKRRIAARERDMATLEVLERFGTEGAELPVVAVKIGADDIDPYHNGFSQLTYLALRRLRKAGKVEKVIRWRVTR